MMETIKEIWDREVGSFLREIKEETKELMKDGDTVIQIVAIIIVFIALTLFVYHLPSGLY